MKRSRAFKASRALFALTLLFVTLNLTSAHAASGTISGYVPEGGNLTLTAQLVPTDLAYTGTVTQSAQYLVTRRTGSR